MKNTNNTLKNCKMIVFLSVLLSLCLFTGCSGVFVQSPSSTTIISPSTTSVQPASELQPQELSFTFSAVGDNLIHSGIYLQARERAGGVGYDFAYAYENLTYFFEQFDVNWINQETLVNSEFEPSSYPLFSSPAELGQATYDAGWRVFALSNNHIYDKGAKGVAATQRFWASMPEDTVSYGVFTNSEDDSGIALQEVNGIKIAYVAYTEHTNGLPTPQGAEGFVIYTDNMPVMERQVRRARELADFVVVSVHWGVEGSHTVVQAQRDLAASYAAWGADIIIGTHPHVIQPVEWIQNPEDGRDVLVAYSLGNFLSAQAYSKNLAGIALSYKVTQIVEPDGTRHPITVQNVQVHPTVTHYEPVYGNIRNYMYRDYTAELAAQHGVLARDSFSVEYIKNLMEQYIDPAFLVLD